MSFNCPHCGQSLEAKENMSWMELALGSPDTAAAPACRRSYKPLAMGVWATAALIGAAAVAAPLIAKGGGREPQQTPGEVQAAAQEAIMTNETAAASTPAAARPKAVTPDKVLDAIRLTSDEVGVQVDVPLTVKPIEFGKAARDMAKSIRSAALAATLLEQAQRFAAKYPSVETVVFVISAQADPKLAAEIIRDGETRVDGTITFSASANEPRSEIRVTWCEFKWCEIGVSDGAIEALRVNLQELPGRPSPTVKSATPSEK